MQKPDISNIKVIIFDVDETLTTENSWKYLTKKFGVDPEENQKIYEKFSRGEIDLQESIDLVVKHWNNGKTRTRKEISDILNSIEIRTGAKEVVNYLKDKYQLAIISGSNNILVKRVAENLGITIWYSLAEIFFNENDEFLTFSYAEDEAEGKIVKFKEFADLKELKPDECAIVGDGYSDTGLFRTLGIGVLLKKDNNQELEKNVDYVINSLDELREIF